MNYFYTYFDNGKDIERVQLYNELKELFQYKKYHEIHIFVQKHTSEISIRDLYEIVLIYGNIQDLRFLYQHYYTSTAYLIPLYSFLIHSVQNRTNVELYQFLFMYYKEVLPSFIDFLSVLEIGNRELLQLFMTYYNKYQPNNEEEVGEINKFFDIKRFFENVQKECSMEYILDLFEMIGKSDYLQNVICTQIGNNLDFTFVSKRRFMEAVKEKVIENSFVEKNKQNPQYMFQQNMYF